ncbi:hypothetical protein LCGC14_0302690 [marine sediment metagenome]|uniref:Uncharacterized protein n=1 Tax=marine sediment metagenome TaxID=412755 RepID=A0A0F9U6R5_9ZZZZ
MEREETSPKRTYEYCNNCDRFLTKYESARDHPEHKIIMKEDSQLAEQKIKIQIDDGELFDIADADIHTIVLILTKLPNILQTRYSSLLQLLNNMRLKYE